MLGLVAKSLSPQFIRPLLAFYCFHPHALARFSYLKSRRAVAILRVLERLLKKIQMGRLSLKHANRLSRRQTSIFLSEADVQGDLQSRLKSDDGRLNFSALQLEFLEALQIDLDDDSSRGLHIRELGDIGPALALVRLSQWLLQLKTLAMAGVDWGSAEFAGQFERVRELGLQDSTRQLVRKLFTASSFDLKCNFGDDARICAFEHPRNHERFYAFRKLNR